MKHDYISRGHCGAARRELFIALTAMGLLQKQIAHMIGCSEKTIQFHRRVIHRELGFSDIARLTHWAIRNNLIRLGDTA